ncbi:MAG: DNA-binding protein [Betaproteobacteria bacterium HGW-Betaproteobacteria-16]|nr:MAG: DNA-binding protein [Betaproteobacteria bacterium HGW-Betaproteobacteria-16]
MSSQQQGDQTIGVEQAYFRNLAEGRFRIQRCLGCERHVFYPREICPHCASCALEWVAPSGRGTVYSYTTVRRKPEAGGDYNVSLIDLEEGVRMMSCVIGVAASSVEIGVPVVAKLVERNGTWSVVFEGAQV